MQLQVRCKFSSKKVVGLEDDAEAGRRFVLYSLLRGTRGGLQLGTTHDGGRRIEGDAD